MSVMLRMVLLVVAIVGSIWILYKVRKSKIKMEDAIFWILSAVLLFAMGLFPKCAYFMAALLGIESPSNFVFAFLLFLSLMKMLSLSIKVSQLEEKQAVMTDELAIGIYELEKRCRHED